MLGLNVGAISTGLSAGIVLTYQGGGFVNFATAMASCRCPSTATWRPAG